ncbi:MAG: hypothetical protein EXS48_03585 [Candidatus Staskawiczbacteria bacterium]|nr:hypothetical protein [Candidatus Staskawiczbacteria bacterium]
MKTRFWVLLVVAVIVIICLAWWDWLLFLGVTVALATGYYIVVGLAHLDIIWTIVKEGWCKIVLENGAFDRTITKPGLRFVGLPFIHTLYKRTMTFFKSVTDEKGKPQAEPHKDKDISSFKTIRFPYAFPFSDEEDSNALPLSGILAGFGIINGDDYETAFFKASDWYAEINTRILSRFRTILATISYDDDIVGRDTEEEQAKKNISQLLWESLNSKQNGNPLTMIEEIYAVVGMKILLVELRTIDPPEGWRATTLAPYKAQREKEAAKHEAQASAALLDDTNQALNAWLRAHNATPEQIREKKTEFKALKEALRVWLGNSPGATPADIKEKQKEVQVLDTWLTDHFTVTPAQRTEKQKELQERAILKAGGQQIHIKGLENASTAVVGGGGAGGAGIFVGGSGNGGKKPKKKKKSDLSDHFSSDDDEDEG